MTDFGLVQEEKELLADTYQDKKEKDKVDYGAFCDEVKGHTGELTTGGPETIPLDIVLFLFVHLL